MLHSAPRAGCQRDQGCCTVHVRELPEAGLQVSKVICKLGGTKALFSHQHFLNPGYLEGSVHHMMFAHDAWAPPLHLKTLPNESDMVNTHPGTVDAGNLSEM